MDETETLAVLRIQFGYRLAIKVEAVYAKENKRKYIERHSHYFIFSSEIHRESCAARPHYTGERNNKFYFYQFKQIIICEIRTFYFKAYLLCWNFSIEVRIFGDKNFRICQLLPDFLFVPKRGVGIGIWVYNWWLMMIWYKSQVTERNSSVRVHQKCVTKKAACIDTTWHKCKKKLCQTKLALYSVPSITTAIP